MKLSNLRLGPVEAGEPVSPFAAGSTGPEQARKAGPEQAPKGPGPSRPHISPQVARPPLDLADPLAMGIEARRHPGWAMAAAIGAVVLTAAGGIVAVLSLVDDRAMVPSSTSVTASFVPADRSGEIPGSAESWMTGTRSLPGTAAPAPATAPAPADRMPEERHGADLAAETTPTALASAGNTVAPDYSARIPLDPALLIARGDEFFAHSDVAAARLFYRRASDGGSAAGANAMGATYDPLIIEQRGLRGIRPEPAAALQWYRLAAQQGNSEADARGLALIERLRTRAAAGDTEARATLERALP